LSITITIGNESVLFPENNEDPGWGEAVTRFAELTEAVLGTVTGVNDKTVTQVPILNNQSSPVDITNLNFSASAVRSFEAPYTIYRISGTNVETESGIMRGNYNSEESDWNFTVERTGYAGMDYVITAGGQVQYYSDNQAGGSYTGLIKYKATTLDV
jgi:hypothetical protein